MILFDAIVEAVAVWTQDAVHTQDEKYGCLRAITSEAQTRATDAHMDRRGKVFWLMREHLAAVF